MRTNKADLYKTIVNDNGKTDYLAVFLYLDIKMEVKRNRNNIFKTSYSFLTKKYNYSQEQIRKKIVKLENLGLVQRAFTAEILPSGYKIHNVLTLSLKEVAK